jgi:hypothetical protein
MTDIEREQRTAARSHRVTAVAWLAGITAVVALGTVGANDSMVTAVCFFILRE